ncbi:MAG: two-component system sensor histidine kinase NtrB [Gemmatimonadota bacterium]
MVHSAGLLRWLYVGRMTLAAGVFAGAVLVWQSATPGETLIATFTLLAAVGFTAASWWYTTVVGRTAGTNFLYTQLVFDTLLVTAIVHITNGPDSSFPPLYILVIAAGALLLPLPGGVLIGALASILYFADLIWFHRLPEAEGQSVNLLLVRVPADMADALLQIGLFALVALSTGALGDRLRQTGHALGQVQSELHKLRLDTDDILGAVDTGLVTVDEAGRLVYMNVAAESVLGLRALNWRGQVMLEELDRRAPGLGTVIRRTIGTRLPVRRYEIRIRTAEGERILGVRTTVLERSGAPSVTAVFQDITDSRQIEELLRRTERLQAVAELGASLAHEIKNPLASIRSAVEQLAESPLSPHDKGTLSRLVVSESNRVSRLLSEFMEFSRVELRKRSAVDFARITTDAIGLVAQHPDAQGGAHIEYKPPRQALLVDGDPDLLHRAVFNLVLNAVQHAGPAGRVRIELGDTTKASVPSSVQLRAPVRLSVRDSGPGIPEEDIPRVFDPFFTTRQGGTGLGLALVHRAIEAHHGTILVDGGSGGGAEFTVYLPAKSEQGSS